MQKCCVATPIYECDHPAPLETFPRSVAKSEIFSTTATTTLETFPSQDFLSPVRLAHIHDEPVATATLPLETLPPHDFSPPVRLLISGDGHFVLILPSNLIPVAGVAFISKRLN